MVYTFNTATAYFGIAGSLYLSQTGCSELKCEAARKSPSKLHLIIAAVLAAVAAATSFYTLIIRRKLVDAYFNDFFDNSAGEKTFMKRMIFQNKFIVDPAHQAKVSNNYYTDNKAKLKQIEHKVQIQKQLEKDLVQFGKVSVASSAQNE